MTCLICGRWAPADPETGYDADSICPGCAAEGWSELADGTLLKEPRDQRETKKEAVTP